MSNCQAHNAEQSMKKYFFRASSLDFRVIPGSPIAYWINDQLRNIFNGASLSEHFQTRLGLSTANNDRFLRNWHEVNFAAILFDCPSRNRAIESDITWFPYEKGGSFRKWFGNHDFLVNWRNDGEEVRNFGADEGKIRSHNYNLDFIFKEGITWSDVTSGTNAFRLMPEGFLFDGRGSSGFVRERQFTNMVLGLLNSTVSTYAISVINPTIAVNVGEIAKLPFPNLDEDASAHVDKTVRMITKVHRADWDSYETSWDFTSLPLLHSDYCLPKLKDSYQKLRAHWREMTLEMQRLEEENNRIFIEAYGLQDELTPEVPLNEITLTCNPHYRYGNDKSEDELEALLLAETMRELVSYAVGCVFGRYSLDKPGLILANQGETLADYLAQVPQPSFPADDDNVIPMLDGDWFTDDIAERFRRFLRVAFGEEHYEENLRFVEQALNIKGKRNYSIRDYFLGEFYTDHVKRYKKRPIYWLFSSPKGSFNALIYMHRYRPDTVSVVLNDYLREFRTKLTSHKNHLEAVSISASSSQGEKTKALKEIEKITKMIAEMEDYEREVLYPLATEQVEIDLDDGVKLNYPKLGAALKKIVGLDAKED
ncbi:MULTISPECIES: BREX-1 system adenine-specific DNA-methyltransferase PglX [Stutzerimonas stutzeri subgroup]|nr:MULTISPECIES: BREX-1 system adenine-specific DNA-methyltransferase PglX [Pseudomonadaceae]MCQ2040520.1 BREX-1 system adenine-specific DNA-methyltransferase PglX [Stutzerimonas kunmingensis]